MSSFRADLQHPLGIPFISSDIQAAFSLGPARLGGMGMMHLAIRVSLQKKPDGLLLMRFRAHRHE